MTSVPSVSQATPASFDWSASSGVAAEVRRVLEAASEYDGRAPLNEATMLSLRHTGLDSSSLWVFPKNTGVAGFALAVAEPERPVEVNLVVDPAERRHGVASALAAAVLAAYPGSPMSAWSHGNHPAAARLAATLGFDRVRDLWVMRRSLREDLPPTRDLEGIAIRTFRPGQDERAFLEVNAAAFAQHPEQGDMTLQDLEQRMAEPWFAPDGFFLAVPTDASPSGGGSATPGSGPAGGAAATAGERLLGFHWTKVHDASPAYGEVYVVGVAPDARGTGLGGLLTLTGLHHLRSRDLDEVILYVEADNAPAVAMYQRLGFTHADADTDVMYARRR